MFDFQFMEAFLSGLNGLPVRLTVATAFSTERNFAQIPSLIGEETIVPYHSQKKTVHAKHTAKVRERFKAKKKNN